MKLRVLIVLTIIIVLAIVIIWTSKRKSDGKGQDQRDFKSVCPHATVMRANVSPLGTPSQEFLNEENPNGVPTVSNMACEVDVNGDITKGGIVLLYENVKPMGLNQHSFTQGLTIADATSHMSSPNRYLFASFIQTDPNHNRFQTFAVSKWRSARNIMVSQLPSDPYFGVMTVQWDPISEAQEYAVQISIRGKMNRIPDSEIHFVSINYGTITSQTSTTLEVPGTSYWNPGELVVFAKIRGYRLCSKSETRSGQIETTI